MKNYFGYIRVSTAKQGERSVSLPEQRAAIERYAAKASLSITDWLEERQTAAKKGRPVWSQMLKALRQGKATGVIIHKIDRSARNLKDWADLGELIDQGIEVHFASESLDLNSRSGRLSADIQAVVAADYIRNLREEAKKGIYGRLKQGFYPLSAPLGYRDNGAGKAKTIDPEKGSLIGQAFTLYLTGGFTLHTLRDEMARRGLRNRNGGLVSVNGWSKILNNVFYTGLIRIKRTGQIFQGNHEPMISQHVFETVQEMLTGRFHTRSIRHEFLFRRLVKCKECGYTLVGETRKGHVYYRCHRRVCSTTSIREEVVEEQFLVHLRALTFTAAEREYLANEIRELKARWIDEREHSLRNIHIERERVSERLARLTDAYIDATIDRQLFEERKSALLAERQALQNGIDLIERNEQSIPVLIEDFLGRAGNAYSLYQTSMTAQKRRMVKNLSSDLTMHDKKVEITLRKPFDEIANREKAADGGLSQGVGRTLEPLLANLHKLFANQPVTWLN